MSVEQKTPAERAPQAAKDSETMVSQCIAGLPSAIFSGAEIAQAYGKTLRELLSEHGVASEPEVVIPNLAAIGRVTLLAAREKLGKSTFAAAAAVAVSAGGVFLGQCVTKGKVLWIGLEEARGDAMRRFVKMGGEPDNLVLLERLEGDGGARQLEVEIRARSPRLVIIDSLARYSSSLVEDENSAGGWTRELGHITDIARRYELAIVILHHANRSNGTYRGSTAIAANVDLLVEMFEAPQDPCARQFKPRGRFLAEPSVVRYDGKAATFEPLQQAAVLEAPMRSRVLTWLAENAGAGKAKIRAGVGGRSEVVDEAIQELLDSGEIAHLGHREGYHVAAAKPGQTADCPGSEN